MRHGHIKLSRKMFDGMDDLWSDEREFSRAEAWIDLIQMAAFKSHRKLVGNQFVDLKRGEILASLRFLSERWRWGRHKVSDFLDLMESMDRIGTVRGTHSGTVYRLVKYDTYQIVGDSSGDTQGDRKGTGAGQEGDRCGTKRSKEVQEVKEVHVVQNQEHSVPSERREESDPFSESMVARRIHALVARWIEQYRERPTEGDIRKQGAAAKRIAEKHTDELCARAVHGIGHIAPYSMGEPWDLFDLEKKFAKAQAAGQYVNGRAPSQNDPDETFKRIYREALDA